MGRFKAALLCCIVFALASAQVARAQSVEPRIVGGSGATIQEYPWQAALVISPAKASGNPHQRQICGGSLITTSIVLTAAHCLYDTDPDCNQFGAQNVCVPDDPNGDGTKRADPDDIDVVLGDTKLSTAPPADEHTVQDVSYQPQFDPDSFQNDIGYLVLSSPVDLSSTVQTIQVAGDDERALWSAGTDVEVSGWGSTVYGGGTVDSLRTATVPIVSDSSCGSNTSYGAAFDPATMVCAGYAEGGVDSCNGDSGGPLEAPLDGGGYRLVGIVSWGYQCARANAPGVYTRIAQSAPGGLRDDVVNRVSELETAYSLTSETIVGSGGKAVAKVVPPPTQPDDPPPTTDPGQPTPKADPFKKCRKLKSRTKRKRCNRKAKLKSGSV
jgi:trypsin